MNQFVTKTYSYRISDGDDRYTIVFITDLHGNEYGRNNRLLVHSVKELKPDAIFVGGDMLIGFSDPKHQKSTKIEVAKKLLSALASVAPVYYSLGNHEIKLPSEVLTEYIGYLSSQGVRFLINEKTDILLADDGRYMSLFGLSLEQKWYPKLRKESLSVSEIERHFNCNRVAGGVKDELVRVLLAHNPAYAESYAAFGADITFSGHYHGGMIRFGNSLGVIGPDFIPLPQYSGGCYTVGDMGLVVSCGLGEHAVPFRVNNPYELVVFNLLY